MKKVLVNQLAWVIVLTASMTTAFAQARPQGFSEQPQAGAQSSDMDSYHNVKYGYSVDFPKRLLIPQGEPDAHDGQRFESKDENFKMVVWGIYNVLERTLSSECEESVKADRKEQSFVVTYKVVKAGWCVFSGVAGSTIIYQKTFLQGDTFKTLRLEYPVQQKQLLDPVVNRIIASFP